MKNLLIIALTIIAFAMSATTPLRADSLRWHQYHTYYYDGGCGCDDNDDD